MARRRRSVSRVIYESRNFSRQCSPATSPTISEFVARIESFVQSKFWPAPSREVSQKDREERGRDSGSELEKEEQNYLLHEYAGNEIIMAGREDNGKAAIARSKYKCKLLV